jgi:hypothetical protein
VVLGFAGDASVVVFVVVHAFAVGDHFELGEIVGGDWVDTLVTPRSIRTLKTSPIQHLQLPHVIRLGQPISQIMQIPLGHPNRLQQLRLQPLLNPLIPHHPQLLTLLDHHRRHQNLLGGRPHTRIDLQHPLNHVAEVQRVGIRDLLVEALDDFLVEALHVFGAEGGL